MERIIESERIVNLNEFEGLIQKARTDILCLKSTLAYGDMKVSNKVVEQLDLKLHQLEAFEFHIERRTITEHGHNEHQ